MSLIDSTNYYCRYFIFLQIRRVKYNFYSDLVLYSLPLSLLLSLLITYIICSLQAIMYKHKVEAVSFSLFKILVELRKFTKSNSRN